VVDETPLNIVSRASRKIAARHLRPLGYRKEFSIDDENLTTNTGHIWSDEVENIQLQMGQPILLWIKENKVSNQPSVHTSTSSLVPRPSSLVLRPSSLSIRHFYQFPYCRFDVDF